MEKMQVNGPGGQKLARKNSLAVGVTCVAINLLHVSKGESLSSAFSTDVSLISASAVPHCGGEFNDCLLLSIFTRTYTHYINSRPTYVHKYVQKYRRTDRQTQH